MLGCMKTEEQIRRQYAQLRGSLDERARREWAGSEAMALGYGGIIKVHRATGMAPSTIGKGMREVQAREGEAPAAAGTRRPARDRCRRGRGNGTSGHRRLPGRNQARTAGRESEMLLVETTWAA